MKYDVFISYSRKDYANEDKTIIPGNIVSQIKDFLQANGYSYWFDEDGIYSSDTFPTVIAEEIHDSEIFLFISTENSNASKWTARELAVAAHLGKKTIPFRVDNSEYATSTLMFLASLDYIEYFKNPQKAFDSLLRTLNKHFSKRKEAEEAERRKKEQEQKAKELAEAMKQAEKLRLERIGEIDTEIEKLQAEIDQCDADSSTIQFRIDGLNEQLAQYKEELNSIANTRNGISASIAKLEQEKMSLLTPASKAKEEKPKSASKKFEKETAKSEESETDEGSSKIMTSWKYLESLKKRYWFHLLLILGLTIATFFFVCDFFLNIDYYKFFDALCTLWGSISIYGVIQLLKGKKDGFVTLLINSITFYLGWYLEAKFSLFAYMGLTIYLFFVATLFIIHKSDKDSPLSWNKMIKSKFKQPKKVLTYVAVISVISSFVVPYIYAQKCGMRSYDIEDADRLLTYSINGIVARGWYAKRMGYEYMPDEKNGYKYSNLEPDVEKALWWYKLAQSNGEDVVKEITYCKEYIEATEKGFVNSEVYGRCGINKENGCLMRINVTGFYDYKNARFSSYDGSKWQSNGSYKIVLENGDLTQGEFEVEGAKVEKIDNVRQKIYDIKGDSVKMRFVQGGDVISERVMPVTKVEPRLILRDENNQKYSGSLKYDEKYTIEVEYPVEGAEFNIQRYNSHNGYDVYIQTNTENKLVFSVRQYYDWGEGKIKITYKKNDEILVSKDLYVREMSKIEKKGITR